MSVSVDPRQEHLLHKGSVSPTFLVELNAQGKTLRFSSDDAVTISGNVYQPYLRDVGTLLTSAHFPENRTASKEYQLEFLNDPVEFEGTQYQHLSQTFDVFAWEQCDANVSLLLKDDHGEEINPLAFYGVGVYGQGVYSPSLYLTGDKNPMPLVVSGVGGTPTDITRERFLFKVASRNVKLNDLIPLRAVTQDDFPEADRDELDGRTFIPIVVGSGVRVRALATTAGATTTVTEEVESGTTLKVSETTGFSAGDNIVVGGFVHNPFLIGTVDPTTKRFLGLTPTLNTLGQKIGVGTVVREDRAFYDFTIADHECGAISEVRVYPKGQPDPVVISGSQFEKRTVTDSNAIGGFRTDVRINQLIAFGAEGEAEVSQQPDFATPGGNHKHNVGINSLSHVTSFAVNTTPGGGSAANDGSEDTAFTLSTAGTTQLTFTDFPSLDGIFVNQRYYVVMQGPVVNGNVLVRRGAVSFLTLTTAFGKAEFRSSLDTGGSATSDFNVVVNDPSPTQCDVFEGWKEVGLSPDVDESFIDLSNTDRTLDTEISVSAADLEIGETVEVVIDGVPIDASGRFGPLTASGTALQRPDHVARWFLEEALGQTSAIIDLAGYAAAGEKYAGNDIRLAFAIQEPIKLDSLLDQIANGSNSIHWWGRDGHNLLFLEEPTGSDHTFVEDEKGVVQVSWDNTYDSLDIRNKLLAFFGRDWTRSKSQKEAYAGAVLREDVDSQVLYGEITNEVVPEERSKAFFLDFVPTSVQAGLIVDSILADKSGPKKRFEVQTDWTYLNVEPGDVIDIDHPTLYEAIRTRVLEQTIDPHLFCRIVAKQVGVVGPSSTNLRSIYWDQAVEGTGMLGLGDITGRAGAWADTWTIHFRHKFNRLPSSESSSAVDFALCANVG